MGWVCVTSISANAIVIEIKIQKHRRESSLPEKWEKNLEIQKIIFETDDEFSFMVDDRQYL